MSGNIFSTLHHHHLNNPTAHTSSPTRQMPKVSTINPQPHPKPQVLLSSIETPTKAHKHTHKQNTTLSLHNMTNYTSKLTQTTAITSNLLQYTSLLWKKIWELSPCWQWHPIWATKIITMPQSTNDDEIFVIKAIDFGIVAVRGDECRWVGHPPWVVGLRRPRRRAVERVGIRRWWLRMSRRRGSWVRRSLKWWR